MTPTLTVAVPTIGRASLKDTLDSIARQRLLPGDQVLVVLDTYDEPPRPDVATLVASYGLPFELHHYNAGVHFFGNPQLNYAMSAAWRTDFFCALGDDDVYVDGAFDRLRARLVLGRAGLCQFLSPWRTVLWDEPVLQEAHISGCCLIAPSMRLVPVKAEHRIEVDFDWIQDVVALTGHEPVWIDDCLIIARPDERHGRRVHAGVRACLDCEEVRYVEDLDPAGLCARCLDEVIA